MFTAALSRPPEPAETARLVALAAQSAKLRGFAGGASGLPARLAGRGPRHLQFEGIHLCSLKP